MPPSVFCGPFQPDLEESFLGRVRAHAGAARPFAVVAPSRRMADRLERLVALEGGLALLGARFHTFYSLALEMLGDAGTGGKANVADGLFHDKVIDRLLSGRPGAARPSKGLAAAYRATLRDLVDAGMEPEPFRLHFGELLSGGEGGRLDELLALQQRYLERLETLSILAPSGLARLAAASAREGRAPALSRYAEILYYGFYDLVGAQAELFEAVAEAFPTAVFFPYRKGHPAFRFAERFYEGKLHSGGPPPEHGSADVSGRALGGALDRLFTADVPSGDRPAPTAGAPGALRIFSASGAGDEAWRAAKEILSLRAQGFTFGDLGIVARSLELWRAPLSQALKENCIPFSLDAGGSILRRPSAKLALTLLTLGRKDYPAQAVLDIIESPYFRLRGRDAARVGNWTKLIERLGIHSGWLQWAGRLGPWTREDFELYPQRVAEGAAGMKIPKEDAAALLGFLERLRRDLAGPAGAKGWKDMVRHARAVLERHLQAPEGDPGLPALSAALEAIESLACFELALPAASWDEFLETAEEKLRRTSLEAPPANRGVRVLDAMDARGESFKVLFLIGLQEGVFPRQVRQDPLLPDAVRVRLRDAAGYWISPKLEGYDEEKLLFYLLVSSASDRLYCSFQRSDEAGKPQGPSFYLRELCRAAGVDLEGGSTERVPRRPLAKLKAVDCGFLAPREILLLAAQREKEVHPLAQHWARLTRPVLRGRDSESFRLLAERFPLFRELELFEGGLESAAELNRAGEPGRMDGLIGSPAAYLRELDEGGLSPGALETFRDCPFRFFASRLLRLKEAEEPSDSGELSARVRGQLYHLVLQNFYAGLSESGYWRKPEEPWKGALEGSIAAALREEGWRELGVYPVLWEALRRKMARALRRSVERDMAVIRRTGLIPAFFERPLRARVGGLSLQGRPDRVDVGPRGFRIVDYKSSWGKWKGSLEANVRRMKALQAPLYLELAGRAEGLFGAGLEPEGTSFRVLEDSPESTGAADVQAFPAGTWAELRGALLENLSAFRGQMERGEFIICPEDGRGGSCEFCDFASVCRKSHRMTRRRAEASRIRAAFDAARAIGGP